MEVKSHVYIVFIVLTTVILPFIYWYFNNDGFKRIINKYSPFKRVQFDSIVKLEDAHLIIKNKEFLNDTKVSQKFKYIFWPVTPTVSPNIIHLLSLYNLTQLSKYGLRIVVFIFDSYYEMITNKSKKIVKQEVKKFQNDLKQMGLRNCRYKVKKESKYVENKLNQDGFAKRFYSYMGSIKYGELVDLKKPHVGSDTPSIRFFKSVLNMLYLKLVPYKVGFTFSGYDEKKLWDIFSKNPVDGQNMRLTNFYLPMLPKLSGGQTNALDKDNNITIDDSEKDIYNKINNNLDCLESNGLIKIVLEVFFQTGEKINVQINDTDSREYTQFDKIKSDLQTDELKDKILISISKKIHGFFHQK